MVTLKESLSFMAFVCALFFWMMPGTIDAACVYSKRMDAQEMDMGTMLVWSTSLEKDNQTFVVQKSVDGLEFVTEGIVRGAGDSEGEKHYRYLDLSVGQSKAFYRLVDIDSKGLYNISETVVINRQNSNDLLITEMSQTETDRYFTVTLQSNVEKQLEYQIINSDNITVQNGAAEVVKGTNVLAMDLNALENGRYKVLLHSDVEQEEVFIFKRNTDGSVNKTNFALKKEDKN